MPRCCLGCRARGRHLSRFDPAFVSAHRSTLTGPRMSKFVRKGGVSAGGSSAPSKLKPTATKVACAAPRVVSDFAVLQALVKRRLSCPTHDILLLSVFYVGTSSQ